MRFREAVLDAYRQVRDDLRRKIEARFGKPSTFGGVTGVFTGLPQNQAPPGNGNATGTGTDVTPVFSWAAPASAPANYWYSFSLDAPNLGLLWYTGWLPSSTTQVTLGVDPTNPNNTSSPLPTGYAYSWSALVVDANGNQGWNTVTYVP